MFKTDLAVEAKEMYDGNEASLKEGVKGYEKNKNGILVNVVDIINEAGEKALGKKIGRYITLTMPEFDKIGKGYFELCLECLVEELKKLLPKKENLSVLVACLGNRRITPDSIGPLCADKLIASHHLKTYKIKGNEIFGDLSVTEPGVLGITGIESADIIKGICEKTKPDLIIAIDALASRNIKRLATTIQLTDTGITPGGGVGNRRGEISKNTLGIPVIAIGVPMVVESATLAIDLIYNHWEEEIYKKVKEKAGDLFVSPKECDTLAEEMSTIIANAINLTFHKIPSKELFLYS